MQFVPIINDKSLTHLTQADWDELGFTHIAIDVINLFIHPHYLIPKTTQTIFLYTAIRSCHKISGKKNQQLFLHSPHNGQKISITREEIQAFIEKIKTDNNNVSLIIMDESNVLSNYNFSDQPGRDAEAGILYADNDKLNIQDEKWANIVEPINKNCMCYTCKHYTLSYLHHLHQVGVPLGVRLGIIHNLFANLSTSPIDTNIL